MLKGRALMYLILFLAGEAAMLAVVPFAARGHRSLLILGLFVFCAVTGLLLMYSLVRMIETNARIQVAESLQKMKDEQLLQLLQAEEDLASVQEHLKDRLKEIPDLLEHLEEEEPALYISRCENPLADAVLFQKTERMKKYGIRYRISASVPEDLDLEPSVLLSLISNLLDNAIEAARRCEEREREVIFSLRVRRGFLVCACENTIPRGTKVDLRQSSKSVPGHGQGLQILEDLCLHRDGTFSGHLENDRCRFEATMRLTEKTA